MNPKQKVREHLQAVIKQGERLALGGRAQENRSACIGWLPRAQHVVDLTTTFESPYRKSAHIIVASVSKVGFAVDGLAGDLVALLRNLADDLDAGMLDTLAETASAEVLDNLLSAARRYHQQGQKEGSSVLAGVVFEDTMRRLHRKHIGPDAGVQLDAIIIALTKASVVSPFQADGCRAAAKLRTSATHARWDEIELRNVDRVISETHQLLDDHFPH